MWPSESHSIPFSPYIFTCKCSLQRIIGWFEACGFCYILCTGPSLELLLYVLLIALCHGGLVALYLQIWPLHLLWQFIDEVGVGLVYLKDLFPGLDGSWVGQVPCICPWISHNWDQY